MHLGLQMPKGAERLLLPCGACFGCRMGYAELWSIRCQHEARLWDRSVFVTLTYDDAHLPWHGGLLYPHLQGFFKRLRKAYRGDHSIPEAGGKLPIRFFAAGEYGAQTDRAHWHILLFNWCPPDFDYLSGRSGIELPSMLRLWPFGSHRVDMFSSGRASYIAGYSAKKVRGKEAARRYEVMNMENGELYQRRAEFCQMSRKPGIGIWYFRRHRKDFERGFVEAEGGVRKRMPRLYAEYLKAEVPGYAELLESRRQEYLAKLDPDEQMDDRLAVREKVHRSRIGTFRKERE